MVQLDIERESSDGSKLKTYGFGPVNLSMLLCLLTIPVDQSRASPWLDCAYMQGRRSYGPFIMLKVIRFKSAVTRVYNEYLDTLNVLLNIYLKKRNMVNGQCAC